MDLDALIAACTDGASPTRVRRRRGSVEIEARGRSFEAPLAVRGIGRAGGARLRAQLELNEAITPELERRLWRLESAGADAPRLRETSRDPGAFELEAGALVVESPALPTRASFEALLAARRIQRPELWTLAEFLATLPRPQGDAPTSRALGARVPTAAALGAALEDAVETLSSALSRAPSTSATRDLRERLRALILAIDAEGLGLVEPAQPAAAGLSLGDLRLADLFCLDALAPTGELAPELARLGRARQWVFVDRLDAPDHPRWLDPLADLGALVVQLDQLGDFTCAEHLVPDFVAALQPQRRGRSTRRDDSASIASRRSRLDIYAGLHAMHRALEHELGGPELDQWLRLALSRLAMPAQRPGLVLVSGLPGVGKSVLARGLRETAEFAWIWGDELAKRLGQGPDSAALYDACLTRAGEICSGGGRALVDAGFVTDVQRQRFIEAARSWGVPVVFLVVDVPPAVARERLVAQLRERAPEANPTQLEAELERAWSAHMAARRAWVPVDVNACRSATLDGSGDVRSLLAQASWALTNAGLL